MSLSERLTRAAAYATIRERRPDVRALQAWEFVCGNHDAASLDEFLCNHKWAYTGTAYGGDDERWLGEGRAYCIHCGKDGDA